jgi:hypothetical protein
MPFIIGCSANNDGSNVAMPVIDYTDFDYIINSDNSSGEYWISLNHSIYLEKVKTNITFLNLQQESSGNIKVTFMITYDGGKDGIDLVEFNTNNPSLTYKLYSMSNTSLQLLEVTITSEKTKAKIKLKQHFIL